MNPYIDTVDRSNNAFFGTLAGLWYEFVSYLPQLVGALIILVVGIIVAMALASLVRQAIRLSRLDLLTDRTGANKLFADAGMPFSLSGLIAWVIKWFFIVVVLIAVADILGWTQVTTFLNQIALYIPNVIVAIVILAIGFVAGHFVSQVVSRSVVASHSLSNELAGVLSAVAKWAIVVFAILAALTQLGIATRLIEIMFGGLVLALALAFGLGGREHAARWLSKLENMDMSKIGPASEPKPMAPTPAHDNQNQQPPSVM
ncbi:MAG: hypothetical protein KBB55_02795 [Candidatus Buchananbacteria bacterium]|nr:hypothetical protein [Candidatus Buchananbacteria bacterium]